MLQMGDTPAQIEYAHGSVLGGKEQSYPGIVGGILDGFVQTLTHGVVVGLVVRGAIDEKEQNRRTKASGHSIRRRSFQGRRCGIGSYVVDPNVISPHGGNYRQR